MVDKHLRDQIIKCLQTFIVEWSTATYWL